MTIDDCGSDGIERRASIDGNCETFALKRIAFHESSAQRRIGPSSLSLDLCLSCTPNYALKGIPGARARVQRTDVQRSRIISRCRTFMPTRDHPSLFPFVSPLSRVPGYRAEENCQPRFRVERSLFRSSSPFPSPPPPTPAEIEESLKKKKKTKTEQQRTQEVLRLHCRRAM